VSEENISIVRRAFEAFTERDADAITALADPEVEFVAPHTAALAREGQPYRGWDGLRCYMEDVARLWQEMQAIPQQFRDLDDTVVVLGRVYARGKDGLLVDSPVGWVWRLRDGKIVWGRGYESHEEALEAISVKRPRGRRSGLS
jgi:ketosteroid isomerase-like protein